MPRLLKALRQYWWILIGIGLLFAVYLLPPDTSLAEVQRDGTLGVCIPTERLPLVTNDPQKPGIEIEILQAIAADLHVALRLNTVPAMGQDFDPKSWGITRAQCAVLAGGVVDSVQTRSFLEASPPYAHTGWVAVSKAATPDLKGLAVGVLATSQGFDRIALSRYLRNAGAMVRIVRSPDELLSGLTDGTLNVGVTEALLAQSLIAGKSFAIRDLPIEDYPLVFGLWKGDLTLKRAIVDAFDRMQGDGRLAAILKRYGVTAS